MILHFLTDEKFTDYVIDQFASDPNTDLLLVSYSSSLQYVSYVENVRVVNPMSDEFAAILQSLDNYKAIVLHGIFWPWQEQILDIIPSSVKVAWEFWGGEIYGRRDLWKSYLGPCSRFYQFIHNLKSFVRGGQMRSAIVDVPVKLLRRIDYCLTSVEEEYLFVKEYLGSNIKFLWFTYYSIEETVGSLMQHTCFGNNIWLGNSSSVENNFFEALNLLHRADLADRKVIVPLSYGTPWLRNKVCSIGEKYFGKSFSPLLDFLPRNEYNKLMLDCSTMIMAHYRPQAQGNIITGLWLGMRVYMSEKSLTYLFLKRIGAVVFSLETDFVNAGDSAFLPLSSEDRFHNRQVLLEWFGKEQMISRYNHVVEVLNA